MRRLVQVFEYTAVGYLALSVLCALGLAGLLAWEARQR